MALARDHGGEDGRDTRSFARPALLMLLPLAVLLSACDEAEQGRILKYEKGTYLGPEDRPLTPEEVEALRQRTMREGG